ncbi:MAG TPA: hypothetical protein DCM08_03700, partial [Microscillaceae bacterium]|nr:hypothetical protein [Microscillaceae bacterium]
SISAGVGFIALFGIAVLNGIMLISHFKQLIDSLAYHDLKAILRQGVDDKFRSILLTSLVAALGYLPMAISQGSGAEVQKP